MSEERYTPTKRLYASYSDEELSQAILEYRAYVKDQRELLDDIRGALRLLREESAFRKGERAAGR